MELDRNGGCEAMNWKSLSRVWLFATPWTIQSMEFSRPEYWNVYPFPTLGDLPNPGVETRSPTSQADSLPAEPQGKPKRYWKGVAISFSRESSQPRDWTHISSVSCTGKRVLYPQHHLGSPCLCVYICTYSAYNYYQLSKMFSMIQASLSKIAPSHELEHIGLPRMSWYFSWMIFSVSQPLY